MLKLRSEGFKTFIADLGTFFPGFPGFTERPENQSSFTPILLWLNFYTAMADTSLEPGACFQ